MNKFVVLAMLLIVYAFNYIDRQLLAVLAPAIKADLGLSDQQLGLLGGIAFAAVYSAMSVPLAMVADRTSRTTVVSIALATWSGFTALCGLATGFWQLFLARMGVGVGEAGGVAPSYAIIAAYFPNDQRARALSVYSLGGPLGAATGLVVGGYLAAQLDWRWAFIIMGGAGLALAPIFRMLVREPLSNARQRSKDGPSAKLRPLLAKRSFLLIAIGAAVGSLGIFALLFWLPSMLQRSYGLSLPEAGRAVGAIILIGGCAGILAGGWLGDYAGRRRRAAYALIPAIAFILCVPLFAIGFTTGTPWLRFMCIAVGYALTCTWLPPVVTACQGLAPTAMQATSAALLLLVVNLVGQGLGPWLAGILSQLLEPDYAQHGLRASLVVTLTAYVLGAIFLYAGSRHLEKDWVTDRQIGV